VSQRRTAVTAQTIAAASAAGEIDTSSGLQRLSVPHPVDRYAYVKQACRGLRVLDLGAYDETEINRTQDGSWRWLHAEIASVASDVLGVDSSEQLRASGSIQTDFGTRIVHGSVDDLDGVLKEFRPDLVVAGELIEHTPHTIGWLSRLGSVAPGTPVLATTPNTTSVINMALSLLHRENAHPDHIQVYSFRTLATLAGRVPMNDVTITPYYYDPHLFKGKVNGAARPVVGGVNAVLRAVQWLFPLTAFGLILEGTVGAPVRSDELTRANAAAASE
jgi:hypothetical protein